VNMFRKFVLGAARSGKKLLEGIWQKGETAGKNITKEAEIQVPASTGRLFSRLRDGFVTQKLAQYARKNLAHDLRQQFNRSPRFREYQGLAGKLSMYAFVGIGFAAHSDVDKKNFENILDNIRDIVASKSHNQGIPEAYKDIETHDLGNYQLGSMIAKGCNAAVYRARFNTGEVEEVMSCEESWSSDSCLSDSDIEVIDEELPPAHFTVQNTTEAQESDFFYLDTEDLTSGIEVISEDGQPTEIQFFMSCDRNAMEADVIPNDSPDCLEKKPPTPDLDHDLAIKMMFNYDVESNALALFRCMEKELLPAQTEHGVELLGNWHNGHRDKEKTRLPPHPNIVSMYGGFVDEMPVLLDAMGSYPDALPQRINPEGFGRNKTLFLVMKRYPWTLREYVASHTLSVRQSLILLTQLVEAMLHMTDHNVAHRDLKSDNIFIEDINRCPHLVVSDFGDCLQTNDLRLHYYTDEISKGGNAALQAPEISSAQPGPGSYLDYNKSDLWTVGTLAYEIFGHENPFYKSSTGKRLNSSNYTEGDLPDLGANIPRVVQCLIRAMLTRDPSKRPSPIQVAMRLHVLLWLPEEWSHSPPSELSVNAGC